jgi:FKBP-type peptidyl-prolyl cis-trans isomerase (trigger factor)
MMQDLRVRLGDVVPYSDADFVQEGDNVILDYEATLDGNKIDNLCSSGEMVTVGKTPIPDFDANLFGMKSGETREFDLHIPKDTLPSLADKTVHFTVTLTIGSKTVPCPLDDSLATKMGKKDLNELREQVHGAAMTRVQGSRKLALHDVIARRLVADNAIEVPSWMSLSEARYLAHQSKLDWDVLPDMDRESLIDMAVKNVKLSLVLDKIREDNPEAQLTDQEVFEIIKQNLSTTKVDKPIDDIIAELNRTGYLQILFSRIRDEHAMDFVSKSVKVIE